MSITIARPQRTRRIAAGIVTTALVGAGVAFATPAQAVSGGSATAGTATWGLSTYLNSANQGRPNPLASGYAGGATFDSTSRLSTWGAGTGTIAANGSASLAFAGTSVNFASTGGGWLRLKDVKAELDRNGNGKVTAEVTYGTSVTGTPGSFTYDPAQAPTRGPVRVTLVDLAGNTPAAAAIALDKATWTDLKGSWSTDFTTFLGGDATATPAIPAWTYASTVSAATDRTPKPFTFSVTKTAEKSAVKIARYKTTKPTTRKNGQTSLYVTTTPGAGPVDGQAKITFKHKSHTTKTKTVSIKNGRAVVKLPKLAKGTWSVSAQYLGNDLFAATTTTGLRSFTVTK